MILFKLARKIQNELLRGKQPFFEMDVSEQETILESFSTPKNLVERSYYQYLCQREQLPVVFRFIQNIVAGFMIPFYLIIKFKRSLRSVKIENNRAIFISGLEDMSYIPNELKTEYSEIIYKSYSSSKSISYKDIKFLMKELHDYWNKPYFIFKVLVKISLYSEQINQYNPIAILTFGEFSFTSSILTLYCQRNRVEHINIMHGEKIFDIRDSFCFFDRYYLWDTYYIKLMKSLRVHANKFIVSQPDILKMNINYFDEFTYTLTYYLGGESKEDLIKIKETLKNLHLSNDEICIRPHPRYSNYNDIHEIFKDYEIEDPSKVNIEESLSKTNIAISLYSTVLYQAYVNGKEIMIDDVSQPKYFSRLKEIGYIMINKGPLFLSSFDYFKQTPKKECE